MYKCKVAIGIEISTSGYYIKYMYDMTGSIEKELENLLKEKGRLESSISRREKLLSNENYINKAPEEVVNKEKEEYSKEKDMLNKIIERLNND